MIDKSFIFLAGHHRSGTSLLHEIIRDHSLVSGLSETGFPEDEGQHLQSVYKPAKAYGGPGKYIFDKDAYMNENHPLATIQSAETILNQWGKHLNFGSNHLIEKSPPNIIRTRFLQKLFPNSKFIIILRHPIAVAFATQKWSKTSLKSLIEHSLLGYEIFLKDLPFLKNAYIIKYEDFVQNPQQEINKIYDFLALDTSPIKHTVLGDANNKYFIMWKAYRKSLLNKIVFPLTKNLEARANKFGYSLEFPEQQIQTDILGHHQITN